MPPSFYHDTQDPSSTVRAYTGYAATPLNHNVTQHVLSPGIQPAVVVCIAVLSFLIMTSLALLFSYWRWRRTYRKIYEQIPESPPSRNHAPLYYRRAQRKKPSKHVRWQSLVLKDSSPHSASSTTHLLSNASTRVNPPTTYASYGGTANRFRYCRSPYYDTQQSRHYDSSSTYADLPSTATTIDSAPMDDLTPPPVPRRSSLRKPPHLNLHITSPEMTEHSISIYHGPRQPTPYPLRDQLSPSPLSAAISISSPRTAATLRPTQLLTPQRIVLSAGRMSTSPGEITPMTPLPPTLFSKPLSDEVD